MGGGAWPLLVVGGICLVNSINKIELFLINSAANGFPLMRDY